MSDQEGWYVILQIGDNTAEQGPHSFRDLEKMARDGRIDEWTKIAHPVHTKRRAVEARRITRLFDIFAQTHELTQLVPVSPKGERPKNELANLPQKRDEMGIARFMADGQDPTVIIKLAERIDGICTRDEQPLYMAVQQKPVANFAPDAVVLTNRRIIIFRQSMFGGLEFKDVLWLNVESVHFAENAVGATIIIREIEGPNEKIAYLPKPQARKVYRIGQDMEEKMAELRRERSMEETRAGATNVVVNNDLGSLVQNAVTQNGQLTHDHDEDIAVLTKLKKMLDAGLIEQHEYDAKKREILDRM